MSDTQQFSHLGHVVKHMPRGAGFCELRAFSDRGRDGFADSFWIPLSSTSAQCASDIQDAHVWAERQSAQGRGVFVGYNRRETTQGTKANVKYVSSAYVDLDLDKANISREAALEHIKYAPLEPDLVIESGGGLHVIHFFEPTEDKAAWERLQTKLVDYYAPVGADRSLRTDEARVLRLSPFPNQKQELRRMTHVVRVKTGAQTNLFTEACLAFGADEEGDELEVSDGKHELAEVIADGGRNDTLFREACALRDRGWNPAEIEPSLLRLNEGRCHPPLDASEVALIAQGTGRYDPTNKLVVISDSELENLVVPFGDFRRTLFPPIPPVIYGLRPGELGLLQARPDVGKTTVGLNLSMCAATGGDFFPLLAEGDAKRVIYADFENYAPFLQHDLEQMSRNFDSAEQELLEQNFFIICDKELGGEPFELTNKAHMDAFVKYAIERKAELIFVDTLAAAFTVLNENDNAEMKREVVKPLTRLARSTGAAVVLVHHIGKAGESGEAVHGTYRAYRSRGASAVPANARLVLDLDNVYDGNRRIVEGLMRLSCVKIKGRKFQDVVYRQNWAARWLEVVPEGLDPALCKSTQDRIWDLITGEMTKAEVVEAVELAGIGASLRVVERALAFGIASGKLKTPRRGLYTPAESPAEGGLNSNGVPTPFFASDELIVRAV